MIHPSESPAVPEPTVLGGLPLIGSAAVLVDKLLADLGMPAWLREIIELVILLIVLYHLVKWLLYQLIPWLARSLVRPALGVVSVIRALLLLPDFIVTRALALGKVGPPVLVYSYGNAVLVLADGMESFVRTSFPAAANLRRLPQKLIIVALLAAFLLWNGTSCVVGTSGAECVSPSSQWSQSLLQWVKEISVKGNN